LALRPESIAIRFSALDHSLREICKLSYEAQPKKEWNQEFECFQRNGCRGFEIERQSSGGSLAEDAVAFFGLAKKLLHSMNRQKAEQQRTTAALNGLSFTSWQADQPAARVL